MGASVSRILRFFRACDNEFATRATNSRSFKASLLAITLFAITFYPSPF
jgi:hypothetical protein